MSVFSTNKLRPQTAPPRRFGKLSQSCLAGAAGTFCTAAVAFYHYWSAAALPKLPYWEILLLGGMGLGGWLTHHIEIWLRRSGPWPAGAPHTIALPIMGAALLFATGLPLAAMLSAFWDMLQTAILVFLSAHLITTHLRGARQDVILNLGSEQLVEGPDGPLNASSKLIYVGNQIIDSTNVYSVSAMEHYSLITLKDRSSKVVRANISSICTQLEHVDGMRIHRSTWVALDAVESTHVKNRVLYIQTTFGRPLRVARAKEHAAKAWLRSKTMSAADFEGAS